MVIKNQQQKKMIRTSAGLLKHRSKKIGYVSTNKLTQQSGNLIRKMAQRRPGLREKRQQIRSQIKKVKKVEEEDYVQGTQLEFNEQVQISPEDEIILQSFQNFNKISLDFANNLKSAQDQQYSENILTNPKVVLVYENVADVLKIYRSGKLPQPFHVIPTLEHWKPVLQLCKPQQWSAQAIFAATKIYSSSMDREQAEYFYSTIILPAVRNSIKTDKKLNIHLYNAVIKALYKPQAWLKGILFPLCQQEDLTIKEAQIIGSIIHKMHIPVIHGAIATYKLAQLNLTGPICILLKVLIEKQYALPEKVLSELINFFLKYANDERTMPVIWHQMILRVCELYKLNEDQKNSLRKLVQLKSHHQISPEILNLLQKKMDVEQ